VLIVQADIFAIPTKSNMFDYVFCFGVLQHTPNPKNAFMELCSRLKDKGQLAVDNYTLPPVGHPYEMLWKNKYRIRSLTASLSEKIILKLVRLYVNVLWPITRMFLLLSERHGVTINRFLLFDDYKARLPGMDKSRFKSFAMLDIYDFLAPKYDKPVYIDELKSWFSEAGLNKNEVHLGYNGLEGRGSR
jgi:SAM-dependent methyltransferase